MHAKSGGSSGEPPDFLFIPAACRSRKDLPRSAGGGDRARNTGNRPRDAEDGATGAGCGARETGARAQGAGPRVRGAGRGCGTRKTRAWGAGRKTRNTWTWTRTRTRARARGHGVQDAGRRTQNTGYWPRAAEHGKRGHGAQETGHRRRGTSPRAWTAARLHTPAQPRNNLPGPFTAGRHPPPGPIRRDLSRLDARRPAPQQPAGAVHSRAPSAAAAATCRAYESESRRCHRARRTCCCRAAPRPT